jgi:hypothetical protein
MPKKLYQIDTGEELDLRDLVGTEDNSKRPAKLSTNQFHVARKHRFFWPLAIISLLILIFVTNYWYRNLKKTVSYDLPDFLKEQLVNNQDNQEQTIAELKNKDTDQDGLTDFAELYQYYTSMFLDDTDSDGIKDGDEVVKGDDPLCPFGEECGLLKLITPDTKLASVLNDLALNGDLTLEQATANEFRKFLLAEGMTEAELANLTDEDLLNILSIVAESQIVPTDSWTATTTPEQVRTFLLSQPDTDVDKIKALSETELITIRDQLIGKQ